MSITLEISVKQSPARRMNCHDRLICCQSPRIFFALLNKNSIVVQREPMMCDSQGDIQPQYRSVVIAHKMATVVAGVAVKR